MAKDAYGNYICGVKPTPLDDLPGSMGGAGGIYVGTWDDPNGNIVPDDPESGAIYYKEPNLNPYDYWIWDITLQQWSHLVGGE